MTTQWPHKHQHLYNVPIEPLELSGKATRALEDLGITSVGDCIDFFIRSYIENPRPIDEEHPYMDEMGEQVKRDDLLLIDVFVSFMFLEVEQKLKDHKYWSFVEDSLNQDDTKS